MSLQSWAIDKLPTMRRWLSILLLVFLPFQFSWAAVGNYCQHESGTQAQHFGHHEHTHKKSAIDAGEASKVKAAGALDVADCHFHCQCAIDLPAAPLMSMCLGIQPVTDWETANASAPPMFRPERPQWVDHS